MKTATNIPYRRNSGIEITKSKPYLNTGSNRSERKRKESAFIGNGKNWPLTIVGNIKYYRFIQNIWDNDGNVIKKILHYLPKSYKK
jgi:hypothetical protein